MCRVLFVLGLVFGLAEGARQVWTSIRGVRVTVRVVEVPLLERQPGARTSGFAPRVRYEVDGEPQELLGMRSSWARSSYKVGQEVPVIHVGGADGRGYVNTLGERWLLPPVLVLGTLFALVAMSGLPGLTRRSPERSRPDG